MFGLGGTDGGFEKGKLRVLALRHEAPVVPWDHRQRGAASLGEVLRVHTLRER